VGNLPQKLVLRTIQNHTEESNLLNASQFCFPVHHSTSMYGADHITLNVNNNISMAAVFLDTEKSSDTTWHSGLLYQFSELELSTKLITVTASFRIDRKFRVLVEGEFSTPRKIGAGVLQGSVLSPILYTLY
jgi:hypothetical protein